LPAEAKVTNIYLEEDFNYVRAVKEAAESSENNYYLYCISNDGREIWRHVDRSPTVSNLVIRKGRLFTATPRELLAFDNRSGKLLYRSEYAPLGSTYPPTVYALGGQIIVIGELVIASFESRSGEPRYIKRFDPALPDGSVLLLDRSLESWSNRNRSPGSRLSNSGSYVSQLAQSSQERSSFLYQRGSRRFNEGDSWGARSDQMLAGIESNFASTYAVTGLYFSTWESMLALEAGQVAAVELKTDQLLKRRVAMRYSIISEFPRMIDGEYAYRPIGIREEFNPFGENSGYIGVALVHLPTGNTSVQRLSKSHREYGLWLLLGEDGKRIFYQGASPDPASDESSASGSYLMQLALDPL
jgi:hypothetical protein